MLAGGGSEAADQARELSLRKGWKGRAKRCTWTSARRSWRRTTTASRSRDPSWPSPPARLSAPSPPMSTTDCAWRDGPSSTARPRTPPRARCPPARRSSHSPLWPRVVEEWGLAEARKIWCCGPPAPNVLTVQGGHGQHGGGRHVKPCGACPRVSARGRCTRTPGKPCPHAEGRRLLVLSSWRQPFAETRRL